MLPDWDTYFLNLADVVATKSKDPNTHVGCVVVGPDKEIRTTGYNSPPRGVDDSIAERFERPEKYFWMEHAERNAFYNAARVGTPMKGCTLYICATPCIDCARAVVQVGIKDIVIDAEGQEVWSVREHWKESMLRSMQLFKEAGIAVRIYDRRKKNETV